MQKNSMKTLVSLTMGVAIFASTAGVTFAQSVGKETIVDALRLKEAPAGARSFRGVGKVGGENQAPKIDLRVQFEYNEAILTDEAKITLNALGSALKDERLDGLKFRVIGHTDARGTDEYNQSLSESRAIEVVSYLRAVQGINKSRLVSSGEGENRLIDAADPESAENRRVEIQTIIE